MKRICGVAILAITALAGCEQDRGVGLGPVGAGGDLTAPQPSRATFEMTGLTPLPVYRFAAGGPVNPASAITVGGSRLRGANSNLAVAIGERTYLMRQVEIGDAVFVVAEGARPVDSLPRDIRTRTGCLVATPPLMSDDAAVYTLDCS